MLLSKVSKILHLHVADKRQFATNSGKKLSDIHIPSEDEAGSVTVRNTDEESPKENELEQLANHMGHDIATHREYYRLPYKTMLLSKVSKILHLADKGQFATNSSKKLSDIHITSEDEAGSDTVSNTDESPKENELEQLANHMGYDLATHREYYRLPYKTMLLSKVSKINHRRSGSGIRQWGVVAMLASRSLPRCRARSRWGGYVVSLEDLCTRFMQQKP